MALLPEDLSASLLAPWSAADTLPRETDQEDSPNKRTLWLQVASLPVTSPPIQKQTPSTSIPTHPLTHHHPSWSSFLFPLPSPPTQLRNKCCLLQLTDRSCREPSHGSRMPFPALSTPDQLHAELIFCSRFQIIECNNLICHWEERKSKKLKLAFFYILYTGMLFVMWTVWFLKTQILSGTGSSTFRASPFLI